MQAYPPIVSPQPVIDLAFPVSGDALPHHHAYALYSALCQEVPSLHDPQLQYQMRSLPVLKGKDGTFLGKLPVDAVLHFRVNLRDFPHFLMLTGQRLNVGGHSLLLGEPTPYRLIPHDTLFSRMVTVKGFSEPEAFLHAVQRQLRERGIEATLSIPTDTSGQPQRRILQIKDKQIVGFPVLVSGLTAEDSLRLQTFGLGGRGKMGCGYFQPIQTQKQSRVYER